MEMSSGSGTKAVGGRLAAESLQSVDACMVTTLQQLKRNNWQQAVISPQSSAGNIHTYVFLKRSLANWIYICIYIV